MPVLKKHFFSKEITFPDNTKPVVLTNKSIEGADKADLLIFTSLKGM